MRTLLAAALLLFSTIAAADDASKVSIQIEPVGDNDHGVVTRIFFRFANPRAITEAGLFIEGSLSQGNDVPRNFHFAVPRKGDKWSWNNVAMRNGKVTKLTRWSALQDQRNEMSMIHTFAEGEAEIQVRLVLEGDYGNGPKLVAETTETFKLAKTNRPFVADASEDDPVVTEEEIPEELGAVTIRASRSSVESKLFPVGVDVLPPVKRVEFFVEAKRISARNTPPYATELDLGPPKPVTLRAIGYDAAGRYVDADAFVVNDNESHISVTITRLVSSDGLCHFKLSVRNPLGTRLKSIVLYAGDRKLHEWTRPPFTLSLPATSLEGVESIQASVIDVTGCEASDRLLLRAKHD